MTGVGKSTLLNALLDERLADSSQRLEGGTKVCTQYTGHVKMDDEQRLVKITDTSGIGDPEVSFEEAMGALVMYNGMLGQVFDIILVCDKDDDRIHQQLRRALQVIDVMSETSGVSPWPNVMLVGTQADRWNKRDPDGKRIDPIERFHSDKLASTIKKAREDGAETCSLTGCPVTAFEEEGTDQPRISIRNLKRKLLDWPSHLDHQNPSQGVQLRVFDMTVLAERYGKIDKSKIEVSEVFELQLKASMEKQELAVAWTDLEHKVAAFRGSVRNCPRILHQSADALQKLVDICEEEKTTTVAAKFLSAELAVLGFIAMLWPPTVAWGIAFGILGGVLGVGAAVQENSASSHRGMTLQDSLKDSASSVATFQSLSLCVRGALKTVMERMNLDQAKLAAMEVEFDYATGSLQTIFGVGRVAGNVVGAALDGAEVVGGVFKTARGGGLGGAVFGGVGAILSVVDLAYTYDQEPPRKSQLETAIRQLRQASRDISAEGEVLGNLVNQAQTFRILLKTESTD